jgi:hypothetical protein
MKILLATDGSKFSEAALRMVIAQNRPQRTRVRVLHVAVPIDIGFPLEMAAGATPELHEVQERQSEQARKLVEGVTGRGCQ